ncbi:MAG: hypothetical protein JO024_01645 [Candidatus Eremiobacteraeota bacterium]|nr:hypothetical protein [Candidatus Eremiobacteraeota bacterium]
MTIRSPRENADTVSLVCALLVRFPEIASVRCVPNDGTVRFTFVVSHRLDRAAQEAIRTAVDEHVDGFLLLGDDVAGIVRVDCEAARGVTFIHVTRDLEGFSKDELVMLVGMFADRFGNALVRNPVTDEHIDEDPAAQEELVSYAIDSLRDPKQSKSLVGFREEKRVLVYFLKSKRKAKASARS